MSQLSLSLDSSLLVRDVTGDYRPANADEVLQAALRVLAGQMRGCEAVVHLAAIANPMFVAPHELFHVNVQGTYNVYEAAAEEGIKRIVQASSINAFGCFWGNRDIAPSYFPLDEAHPTGTTDVYSFSKEVVEDIGEYYWRRNGITSISLRFPGVWSHHRMASDEAKAHRQHMRDVLDEFVAQPAAQQQERKDQRGAGAVADDRAVGAYLPRGRRADRAEDAGADDGADREHDQVAGAEHALERLARLLVLLDQRLDRFGAEQMHAAHYIPSRRHSVSDPATTTPPPGSNASPTSEPAASTRSPVTSPAVRS